LRTGPSGWDSISGLLEGSTNTGSGILAVAGLPSAVDVCDVPIESAAVAWCSSCEFLLLLLVSLLNVAVFANVADFPSALI
jgi:hypothetical protein